MARGRAARRLLPLAGLADAGPRGNGPAPVELLERQARTRMPRLVPVRYGRMAASPFAFYRGAALVMTADLATTARTDLTVQLCGDAHVANFGIFGTPERRLLFDLNDFDETLPGPFEWDVKRMLASVELVARANDLNRRARRRVLTAAAREYRTAVADFAGQRNLEVWYARIEVEDALRELEASAGRRVVRRTLSAVEKARGRDHLQSVAKLTTTVDGRRRFVPDPPLVTTLAEMLGDDEANFVIQMERMVRAYRRSLQADRRHLLEQYRLVDMALKVVGVGSVGTRAWILLMEGIDGDDAIVLQAKEAQASVLEEFVGASRYHNHGERVVQGQRIMQAASDALLGWQRSQGLDGVSRDYYVRQLRDWKGAVPLDELGEEGLRTYARLCAWTLARAHARSGDRVAIAAYLGDTAEADEALADFAVTYADRTERDHRGLLAAIEDGTLPAVTGV